MLKRHYFYLILTFAFALPFFDLPFLNIYDSKRLIQLVLLSSSLIYYAFLGHRDFVINANIAIWLLIVVVLGAVSSLLAHSIQYALLELCLYISLYILIHSVASLYLEKQGVLFNQISLILFCIAMFYSLSLLVAYSAGVLHGLPIHWQNLIFGYSNPRFFNQFQIWTFPLLIQSYFFFKQRSKIESLFAGFIISLWWSLLFLSASRGALIAVVLSILITNIVFKTAAQQLCKLQLRFGFIGLLIFVIIFKAIPEIIQLNQTQPLVSFISTESASARIILWEKAITIFLANPLLGAGPMHYSWFPNHIASHPHNSLLLIASEWGGLVLTIILAVSMYCLYQWVEHFRARVKNYHGGTIYQPAVLFNSLLAGLIFSLGSGVTVMPQAQLMMAIVLGLMLGLYIRARRDNIVRKIKSLSLCFSLTTLVCLWLVAIPILKDQALFVDNGKIQNQLTHGPRFLQLGGIPHE